MGEETTGDGRKGGGAQMLTREELYELVWSTPVRTLAPRFGLSDVGLAKICRGLGVPRPCKGYWARIQHGQKPRRAPLPPKSADAPASRTISASMRRPESRSPPPAVPVSRILSAPHPAINVLGRALPARKRSEVLGLPGQGQSIFRVGGASRDRALRILDAFAKTLSVRGHEVRVKPPDRAYGVYTFEVVVAGRPIGLSLQEHLTRSDHPRRPGESTTYPRYDFTPSGQLTLRVGGFGSDPHRSWSDRRRQRLEEKLGEAVLGTETVAAEQLVVDREREEWRERYRTDERQRAVAKLRAEHEAALADDLAHMAAAWRESRQIRLFVEAVEEAVPPAFREEGFASWLAWARAYAERRDPFSHPEGIAKRLDPKLPPGLGDRPWGADFSTLSNRRKR